MKFLNEKMNQSCMSSKFKSEINIDVTNALYILRIENILKKIIVIFIVDRFSFIKFHIIALQFTMYDFFRNDDEVIFHSRAYQFEMLKKNLNDHQMNTESGKTNMHIL